MTYTCLRNTFSLVIDNMNVTFSVINTCTGVCGVCVCVYVHIHFLCDGGEVAYIREQNGDAAQLGVAQLHTIEAPIGRNDFLEFFRYENLQYFLELKA